MNINIDLNDLKERAKDLAQSGMAKARIGRASCRERV